MKRLTYTRPHNLAQLTDELIVAVPTLVQTNPDGTRQALCSVSGDGAVATLGVPDNVPDATIAAVVNAHVVNPTHGQDAPFEQATAWLKGTAWPILQTTPPGALTALQQANYNKSLLIMVRRLFQELR